MQTKELLLKATLMLIASIAGIVTYQTFFPSNDTATIQPRTPVVDINNIDLSQLIARDFTGTHVNLSAYQGKHLIINFWATWCPPCRKEIPYLKEIQTHYVSSEVQVLGIAMDEAKKVDVYMQQIEMNYPSLISDLNQTTRFGQQLNYQFIALPFTFFINKDGKLIHTKTGELSLSELKNWTETLISSAE